MKYFGYQKGIGGTPSAVLWHDLPTDGNNKEQTEGVYYKFALQPEDESLTFEELKRKYPFKGETCKAANIE